MEKNTIKLYGDKVWGITVSSYGLENGYLDYYTLSKIVGDRILNNTIINAVHDWELVAGDDYNEEEDYQYDIYQFYSETLDVYLWGITHFGTSWDYVLTDVKLV